MLHDKEEKFSRIAELYEMTKKESDNAVGHESYIISEG